MNTAVVARPKSEPYSKQAAALIGFITMLPIAYMFVFFLLVILLMAGNPASHKGPFIILFIFHFAMIILSWCLTAFYIYYLFKTDYVPQDKKALWAVVIFLGNMLAMPIFWYIYIWKPAEIAR